MTIQYDPNPPTEVYKAQAQDTRSGQNHLPLRKRDGATPGQHKTSSRQVRHATLCFRHHPHLKPRLACENTFNNGHVTRLGGVSKLIIESVKGTGSAQQSVLNLLNGQVLIEVQKLDKQNPQNTFQIKTPVSISAVKGTKFLTTYGKSPNRNQGDRGTGASF